MANWRESWVGAAIDRLQERISQARPAWELRANRPALRAWVRYRGAVADALGETEAQAYTDLIIQISQQDPEIARTLALTLPDQLPRIPPDQRPRYFELLAQSQQQNILALPMLARTLPDLLERMDNTMLQGFLEEGIQLYTQSPQRAESFFRQESEIGQQTAKRLRKGTPLQDVSKTLSHYARAHCGEDVQIRPGAGNTFSDGHHLYLPEEIAQFGDERDFLMYRVLTAIAAAYLEFGTFDLDLKTLPGQWPTPQEGESELERFFRTFPNHSLARDLFAILEDHRIEHHLRREYPGIARDLDTLSGHIRKESTPPEGPAAKAIEALARRTWQLKPLLLKPEEEAAIAPLIAALEHIKTADVHTVARLVTTHYPAVESLMRRAETKGPNAPSPQRPPGDKGRPSPQPTAQQAPQQPQRIRPERAAPEDRDIETQVRQRRETQNDPQRPTETRRQIRQEAKKRDNTLASLEAALERNPPPGGAIVPDEPEDNTRLKTGPRPELDPDLLPGEKIYRYREWDSTIADYKPDWTTVRERRLKEGSFQYVNDVMQRHRQTITDLRRRFEALRPQALVRETRLTDGSDLDLDRVIERHVNARAGAERSDRVYARDIRARRDVAVALLLDMSSSTNESADGSSRRIIDVEKEALILSAEAIASLGDTFAIFGFSGYGRAQVAFYIAKDFNDPWDDRSRSRVGRISFKMENRDGAAIRHATARLQKWPARTRLLIHISDGKPLDCGCDHYYDRYAQDDTRAALREARQAGIHPFCITVDPNARNYLPRMFGEVAYTVIDRVELLPSRLIQVYRRLAV